MPSTPPILPKRIEIVAYPAVQLLDVAGPLQVFACANDLAVAAGEPPPYSPVVVATGGGLVAASAGLALAAEPLPASSVSVDTLLVAGGRGVHPACDDANLREWLRSRAGDARRVASVCSGAFLLASAGLLDGRRAATPLGALRRTKPALPGRDGGDRSHLRA